MKSLTAERRLETAVAAQDDEAALDVLAQLLSGKTGRLYKRLVTKEEVAMRQPSASNGSRKYAGYFEINVTVKDGKSPEQAEQMILEEIDKLREGEITDYEIQKVKNQVLAASVQRLRSNTGLMFQLAIYDLWYDWSYMNESPERMLQVTADDVRRMVKNYFDPKTRTVAIYRTKPGVKKDEDPELAVALSSMPEETHSQIKMQLTKIKESTDLEKLQTGMERMDQALASGQVPEDQKRLMALMLKTIKSRVAELEAAKKESK